MLLRPEFFNFLLKHYKALLLLLLRSCFRILILEKIYQYLYVFPLAWFESNPNQRPSFQYHDRNLTTGEVYSRTIHALGGTSTTSHNRNETPDVIAAEWITLGRIIQAEPDDVPFTNPFESNKISFLMLLPPLC